MALAIWRAGCARKSEPLTAPPAKPYPRYEAAWRVCHHNWLSEFHDSRDLELPRIWLIHLLLFALFSEP
jgi:hypothetical protein